MVTKEGSFKGRPTITLAEDEDHLEYVKGENTPFSFGLKKAKLILGNIKEIEKFVSNHEKDTKEIE